MDVSQLQYTLERAGGYGYRNVGFIRQSDRGYRMDYAVTATQKEILKAFNMTATNIRTQAAAMNEDLMQIEKEE